MARRGRAEAPAKVLEAGGGRPAKNPAPKNEPRPAKSGYKVSKAEHGKAR